MTIIFNKRTGAIKASFSGDLQTISTVYGDEAQDYSLIWDEITIPDDDFVLRNTPNFQINTETQTLEMLHQDKQYPIASQ